MEIKTQKILESHPMEVSLGLGVGLKLLKLLKDQNNQLGCSDE